MSLPKRKLGNTGLDVTVLGFGAMELRGPARKGPEVSDDQAERVLNAALDAGINFIDTSIDYGRSQELIGRYISHRRNEYYLASKCGCIAESKGLDDHVHTAAHMRANVEECLRMMKTDHLDLIQFHKSAEPHEFTDQGALEELRKLKEEGKVGAIGVSGRLPNLPSQIDMGVFESFQIPYSALQREHEGLIQDAANTGAGIIIRGGVAAGVPDDWAGRTYFMMPTDELQRRWQKANLDDLLNGMSSMEFMLRFTISNPNLNTTIVGTKSPEHLQDNVAAAEKGPLPADVYEEAKRRLDQP